VSPKERATIKKIIREIELEKKKLMLTDLLAAVIAFANGGVAYLENNLFEEEKVSREGVIIKASATATDTTIALRFMMILIAIALDVLVMMRYTFSIAVYKRQTGIKEKISLCS